MCKALEDLYKEGIEAGREEGIEYGRIQEFIECFQEFHKTKEEALEKLVTKFLLPRGKAEEYVKQYWK